MTNGSGIRNQLAGGDRQSAGKTGTANNNNESWFVGYTPQLVTAVWVGTPYDPITRVMKNVRVGGQFYPVMHGAAIAAPIWKQIMNGALEDAPIVTFKEPAAKYLQADPADTQTVTPGQLPAVVGKTRARGRGAAAGGRLPDPARRHDGLSQLEAGLVAGISPYQSPPPGSMITIYTSRGNGGVSRQGPDPATHAHPGRAAHRLHAAGHGPTPSTHRQAEGHRSPPSRRSLADPGADVTKGRCSPRRPFVVCGPPGRSGMPSGRLSPAGRRSARQHPADDSGDPATLRAARHGGVRSLHREAHLRHTGSS